MSHESLEEELLRALRAGPDRTLDDLADAVGIPRTNFGRSLTRRIEAHVRGLIADGLVEEHASRFRLSDRGRRTLAERALGEPPPE